ncbi:MAG TPA: hypothetical protein VH479_16355 [Acidimicrobiales bacterium]
MHDAFVLGRRRPRTEFWSGTTVVGGPVAPGPFEFRRNEVSPGRLAPKAVYAFDGVVADGAQFDLTDVVLTIQRSAFSACRFVQKRRRASDGTGGSGSLARHASVYRECVFEGVRFRVRGGFSVGAARFERCTFIRCDFGEHFSFCADHIDCTFVGPVKRAVFYGQAPEGHHCDGKRNVFEGNDFTEAVLHDVGFRGGIDATLQRWREGFDPTPFMNA